MFRTGASSGAGRRSRGSFLLAATVGLGLVASTAPAAGATPAPTAASATATAAADVLTPFDAVDQLIGTQLDTTQNKSNDAYGNTYPGAALPFGMVQPSPTTYKTNEPNGLVQEKGGYEYTADQIRGFGMTRYSGTGCHTRFGGYEFPTIPFTGELATDGTLPRNPATQDHRSYFLDFSHADEVSEPGYYQVTTADGTSTELTATRRTAVSRFDFSEADGSTLILDASGANNRTFEVSIDIDPDTSTVSGSMYGTDVCDNGNFYRAYFSTTYDQAFDSFGTWTNATMTAGSEQASVTGDTGSDQRHKTGGWVTFADGAVVTAKTGFSYTSVEAAAANAVAETTGQGFDDVRADAKATWEEALGTVEVAGGTDAERTKLYTALYRSLLQPTIGNDADGSYRGFDNAMHQVEAGHDFFRRINFAGQGWDMYRSQAQLIAMLFPDVASDINRSIVALTQQTGKWSPGAARMSGDNYQVILSTLDAFGATDYDRQAALASMKATQLLPATDSTRTEAFQYAATGLIENRKGNHATSRVLEYAVDDFAIAQLAQRLEDDATYDTFMVRAQNWRNVFDPQTQHVRPRERTGFDRGQNLANRGTGSYGEQFNQSTGYQYGWMVPHNIGELVKLRGGRAASTRAMDTLMAELDAGAYDKTGNYLSNEAALITPWVYNWLQAPHKTTDVLRRAVDEMYTTTPKGLPGNDDEGALSSWYVFANLGIAPMIHGTANLLVTAPMFDQVTLRSVGSERVYEINAPGVSEGRRYTTGLAVDGVAQTKSWVGEDFARTGGTLDFTMAATPGTWGTGADDVPPSFNDGANERNNVGTTANGARNMGSMDLSDWAFSRQTLASSGAAPGATVAHGTTGIEFTWPDTAPGEPDNWIPSGQRVDLEDSRAATISFLGLATNGPSTANAVVEYTDGSTQQVPVTFADWSNGSPTNGNSVLVTVNGRNSAVGGTGTGAFRVFGTRPAPLDSSKTVAAVRLPEARYSGIMHIFDVATSTQEFVDPNAPTGTPDRIILTAPEDPSTSQYVTWRSTSSLPLDGKVEVRTVGGEARTVDAEEKPERTLNGYPSRSHSAKLTDLTPGTTYQYRVGAGTTWSSWASFTTALATDEDFTFLYFGDAQEGIDTVWPQSVSAAWAAAPEAELSLYAGDMTNTSTIEKEWDDWIGGLGDAARTSNALPTPGNHEVGPEPFMEHYLDTFEHDANGPVAADAGTFESTYGEHIASVLKDTVYYSDYQGVRFVVMNANRDDICQLITPPGLATFNCDTGRQVWMSMQAEWLDRVLSDNPNKWTVVQAHQPVFSTGISGNGLRDEDNWRRTVGPVLERHDVDLVLQGHDHTYGRGYLARNASTREGTSTGPVYVVANAGQKQYTLPSATDNIWTRNNATAVVRAQDTSTFQKIRVEGDTLTYQSVVTHVRAGGAATKNVGDTLDSFTVTKYDDGAKWVTETGVAAPGPEVASEAVTRASSEPFDPADWGIAWDDDFDTDQLSSYTTRAGNEAAADLAVDTASGVLRATAAGGRRWTHVNPPVGGSDRWAIVVEPAAFAGTRSAEDSLFVGASASNTDLLLNWYNHTGRMTGYDATVGGTGRTMGRANTGLSVDPGDRVAFVHDHGQVSSWIEEDGSWRRYNVALASYAIPDATLASWKPTFSLRLDPGAIAIDRVTVLSGEPVVAPDPVTPAAVTFDDAFGASNDTYTVPVTDGVEYVVGGAVVAAGTYPGSGTVTVTARASGEAPIAEGATTEWTRTFTTDAVTPAAVTFTDRPGAVDDSYTVPATAGVEYVVGGAVVAAGTHPGSGTVMVTARATGAAPVAQGATTSWSHTFATTRDSVALTLTSGGGTYGTATTVSGTLASAAGPVTGDVVVTVDGNAFRTVAVSGGAFSVELDAALAAGTHRIGASYSGTDRVDAGSGQVDVAVAKAEPEVTLKVTPRKAKPGKRLTAVVRVTIPGSVVVDGKVRISVAGRTVTASLSGGKARVKLPALGKRQQVKVKALYVASTSVEAGRATPVKVRAKR